MRLRGIKLVAILTAVAVLVTSLAPGGALADTLRLNDDVLGVTVSEQNGRIGVRTTGGDPMRERDGEQPLIYGPEQPQTSFTSFRIDGEEVIYGHTYGPESAPYGYFVEVPQLQGERIVSVWRYRGVDIRQTVELVAQEDTTLPAGNSLLSYQVENRSGQSVRIGTRMLLDVAAGDNDGPLLMAPGELSPIVGEREFGPEQVPLYWQAMDNIDDPSVIAYGTLYGFGEAKPSRVIFGHWNGLSASKWEYEWSQWTDYTVPGNLYGTADSAVAVYWDETPLAAGATTSYSTLIGMGEMEQRQSQLQHMAITIAAPQKVAAGADGRASFELSAELSNNLAQSMDRQDVRVEILHPNSVLLSGGSQPLAYVPLLRRGERLSLKWQFRTTSLDAVNAYAFKLRVTVGDPAQPGVQRREETAHVIVLNDFRQPPEIQFTAVTPNRMYEKEAFRKVLIHGSQMNFLNDSSERWEVYVQGPDGERTTIASRYVAVENNNLLSVFLPELALGSYGIGIEHELGKGMYLPDAVRITDDVSVMTRGYGTLLITKREMLKTRTDFGGQYTHLSNNIYYTKGGAIPAVPAGEQEVLRIQGNIQDMGNGTYSVVPHPSQAVSIGNVLKLTVAEYADDLPGEIVVRPITYAYEDNGLIYDRATQAAISGNDQSRIYLNPLVGLPHSPLIWKQAFAFNVNDIKIEKPNVFGFSDAAQAIIGPYVLGIKQLRVVYDADLKQYAAEFKGALDLLSILKTLYKYFGTNEKLNKLLYAEVAVDKFRVYENGQIRFALEAGIGLPQLKIGPFVSTESLRPSQTGGVEGRLRIDTIQNLYSIYANLSLPNLEAVPTGNGGNFMRSSRIRGKFGIFTVPTPEGGFMVFPDEFMAEYADNVGFISIPNIPLSINQLGGEIKGLHTIRDSIDKGIYPDFNGSFWFGVTDTFSPVLFGRRALSASDVRLSIGAREASISGTASLYFFPIADMTGKIMFYPVNGALIAGRVSLLDIIVGQAAVELSYNFDASQYYFGGYVRGFMQIPPYSPMFPGLKLMDASAALNTDFFQAYAMVLGHVPVGVRYTWSTQQTQVYSPQQKDFSAVAGRVQAASQTLEPELLEVGTNLTPIPLRRMTGEVRTLAQTTRHTLVSDGEGAMLLQARYDKDSDMEWTVTDPDGEVYPLVYEGDEANTFLSEYVDPDTAAVQGYIAVAVAAGRNKAGTWTIQSSVPGEFEAFSVAALPELETVSAAQDGTKVVIDLQLTEAPGDVSNAGDAGDAGDAPVGDAPNAGGVGNSGGTDGAGGTDGTSGVEGTGGALTTVDLFLESVDARLPFLTRIIADGAVATQTLSLEAELPDSLASGDYKIVAVLKRTDEAGDQLQSSFRESEPFAIMNPRLPDAPTAVTATAIGRGVVKVEWDAVETEGVSGYHIFTIDEDGLPSDGSRWAFVPHEAGVARYTTEISGWPPDTYELVVQAVREEQADQANDPYAGYPQSRWTYIEDPRTLGQYVATWNVLEGITDYLIHLTDEEGQVYTIPYSSELYVYDEELDVHYYETTLYGLPPGKDFDITVYGVERPSLAATGVVATDSGPGRKRVSWNRVAVDDVRSYTIYAQPKTEEGAQLEDGAQPQDGAQPEDGVQQEAGSQPGNALQTEENSVVIYQHPVPAAGQPGRYMNIEVDGFAEGADYEISVIANVEEAQPEQYYGPWSEPVQLTLPVPEPPVFDLAVQPFELNGRDRVRTMRDESGLPYFQSSTIDVNLSFTSDRAVRTEVRVNPSMYDPLSEAVVYSGNSWTANVQLREGVNEIEVIAYNARGDADERLYRIAVKESGPMLAVADADFVDGHAVLSGRTDVGAFLAINGYPAEIDEQGQFEFQMPLPDQQVFDVEFTATDAYGNANIYVQRLFNPTARDIEQVLIGMPREMRSGERQPLILYAYDGDGQAVQLPNEAVEWTLLSGNSYVELTASELKGLRQGQAVIAASYRVSENYVWTDYGIFDIDQNTIVAMTDQEMALADLGSLAIGYAEDEGPTGVTRKLVLPTVGVYESTVEWTSSHPDVIDASSGEVQRPAADGEDVVVTLTAVVTKGVITQSKTFLIRVLREATEEPGGGDEGENPGGGDEGESPGGGDEGESPGGGSSGPSPSQELSGWSIDPKVGGIVSVAGASIRFPAGSFPRTFRVFVEPMSEEAATKLPDAARRISRIYEITKSATGIFLKPVTVTLPFDRARVQEGVDRIAVYWFNELTREWVRLNSTAIDWRRGTISGETIHFTKFAVLTVPGELPTGEPLPEFSDISGHWAESSIRTMVGHGYVNGYPDGTFRPNMQVTRAEFVELLARIFELAPANGAIGRFDDTVSHWAREAIAAASAAGIVAGYDSRHFGPNDLITREQMSVLLSRALQLTSSNGAVGIRFNDRSRIASWALPSVAAAVEHGLFRGYADGTFRPRAHATRAEAVQALTRAIALRDRNEKRVTNKEERVTNTNNE